MPTPRPSSGRSTQGFSLLEVMIGLIIFTILSLSMAGLVDYLLRNAHRNILRNTAFTVAESFMEQIKSVDRNILYNATIDPRTKIPTSSVSELEAGVVEEDPLYITEPSPDPSGPNHKRVLIDRKVAADGTVTPITMDMWFTVAVTPLLDGRGFLIKLDYSYSYPPVVEESETFTLSLVRSQ